MLSGLDQYPFDIDGRRAVLFVAKEYITQLKLAFQLFAAKIGPLRFTVLRRSYDRFQPVERAFDVAPPRQGTR